MKKIINYTLILAVALTGIIACSSDEENVTGENEKGKNETGEGNTTNPVSTKGIYIADDTFRAYLIDKQEVVIDFEGYIKKEEADKVTQIELDSHLSVKVKTYDGIEAFTKLQTITLGDNGIVTKIDLSKNVNLKGVSIYLNSELKTLKLNNNKILEQVRIHDNKSLEEVNIICLSVLFP